MIVERSEMGMKVVAALPGILTMITARMRDK
jgi:hypothetical protein